ncbi:N-acetylmuramic acid-6-phosphate etherase [Psychromonas sp. CNPT3]|uniref:N-acetylmuramic acid 6-phosphate etherase n=1 Tax=Psychromonas sp. CNPT3 TaxID=314282 RepID=UPI00006E569A|nr:N-acetylmuramic acid 6-phosphate etherase [Psychromonas sp. CNPT3]AGH81506.1 N-acetylmuramic acid-6-phosphate etherase [Psychromonas sp. CNPT3]
MKIDLSKMTTESRNPASAQIDTLSTLEMLKVINTEDQKVAIAVQKCLPEIAQVVDAVALAFSQEGRLIYIGAGTSGRLGILDASECPPTYGTPESLVIGRIAGGRPAIFKAVENAEDNMQLGESDLKDINLSAQDVVVGVAASGRTPYVLGAMQYALSMGASVASLTCNLGSPMAKLAKIAIQPIVGAEVITGSSRMKAGTAQKLVLNMISTGAMIKTGKVFGNLMVDVKASNAKLVQRQQNIVVEATGCTLSRAQQALSECNDHCKTAILMCLTGWDVKRASEELAQKKGFIAEVLNEHT